jgi:hypothetical protein
MPDDPVVFLEELTVIIFGSLFLVAATIELGTKTDNKFFRFERITAFILSIVFFALSAMAVMPYYYHVGLSVRMFTMVTILSQGL